MKIYKAKNGKEFRLAGLSCSNKGDIVTVFWILEKRYEEFTYLQIESYLTFEIKKEVSVVKVIKKEVVKKEVKTVKKTVKKPKPPPAAELFSI